MTLHSTANRAESFVFSMIAYVSAVETFRASNGKQLANSVREALMMPRRLYTMSPEVVILSRRAWNFLRISGMS